MKNFFVGVLGVLVASAISAEALALWTFNDRLARIETKIEFLSSSTKTTTAQTP